MNANLACISPHECPETCNRCHDTSRCRMPPLTNEQCTTHDHVEEGWEGRVLGRQLGWARGKRMTCSDGFLFLLLTFFMSSVLRFFHPLLTFLLVASLHSVLPSLLLEGCQRFLDCVLRKHRHFARHPPLVLRTPWRRHWWRNSLFCL